MTTLIGNERVPYRRFLKWVGTVSARERKVRLLRIVWSGNGGPCSTHRNDSDMGYSAKLSLNLRPRIFYWKRERFDWRLCLFGIELHGQKHYGGWIT